MGELILSILYCVSMGLVGRVPMVYLLEFMPTTAPGIFKDGVEVIEAFSVNG